MTEASSTFIIPAVSSALTTVIGITAITRIAIIAAEIGGGVVGAIDITENADNAVAGIFGSLLLWYRAKVKPPCKVPNLTLRPNGVRMFPPNLYRRVLLSRENRVLITIAIIMARL
jgi:hypothetical protein